MTAAGKRLVLASGNTGKLAELRGLLDGCGFALHAQSEFGVRNADETANTFVENALLRELRDVPKAQRGARFYCVLVLLRSAEDPQPLIAEGEWRGRILDAPHGAGGFGYDPVFFDPEHGCSAAELDPALKNRISHRGRALAVLRQRLGEFL
jgi:XTP/dITP diphosphohydrolase